MIICIEKFSHSEFIKSKLNNYLKWSGYNYSIISDIDSIDEIQDMLLITSKETDKNISQIIIKNFPNDITIKNCTSKEYIDIFNIILHFNQTKKKLYFSRHGESVYNTRKLIGGNSELSNKGFKYAESLFDYVDKLKIPNLTIYTSTLKRTIQTVGKFSCYRVIHCKELDEINSGLLNGITYDYIKVNQPEEYFKRKNDKYNYRYPMGESYADLRNRLKSFILKLEKSNTPVLVVAHQAVLRVIFAYYESIDETKIPYVVVPLHNVFCYENDNMSSIDLLPL